MGALMPKEIAYSEKCEYARCNGFARPKTRFDAFMMFLRAQDHEYLVWYSERTKQE